MDRSEYKFLTDDELDFKIESTKKELASLEMERIERKIMKSGFMSFPEYKTFNTPYRSVEHKQVCLHEQCASCKGTGKRIDGNGYCVHHISCPCPKCTPIY